MSRFKYFVFLFPLCLIFAGTSCKSKKNSAEVNAILEANYRLVVAFISMGSGIDGKALDAVTKYIENHPKKPQFEKYNWGREGEMDICLKLSELSTKEQKSFIDELKKIVGNSSLVQVSENAPCVHKK